MDRRDVTARALASRAEDLTARSNAQDTRARSRCFRAKLGEHGVEHRAGDLIAVLSVVQRKGQDIAGPLNHQSGRGIRAGEFNRFG
jgi:hypothetical protein